MADPTRDYVLEVSFDSDNQAAIDTLSATIAQVAPFMVDNVTVELVNFRTREVVEYGAISA